MKKGNGKELDLADTQVSNLWLFAEFAELRGLHLDNTQVTDISAEPRVAAR